MNNHKFVNFDNTKSIKTLANNTVLHDAKGGSGKYKFNVGDVVITGKSCILKPGIELTVKGRDLVNDYPRYFAGGVWLRECDLD